MKRVLIDSQEFYFFDYELFAVCSLLDFLSLKGILSVSYCVKDVEDFFDDAEICNFCDFSDGKELM